MTDPVARAVEGGDLDELVRLVDGLASARDWPQMVRLRDLSRHAVERGLQLWPAAEYAEYRLALEAPGAFAGAVVSETAGRFALGPLWEVAASTHEWSALAGHLAVGPARTLAAHERVLRGEDLRADRSIDATVLDLPLVLAPWERYPVATYHASRAEFPSPAPPQLRSRALPAPGAVAGESPAVEALLAIALPWQEQSNGRVGAAEVRGDPAAAISAVFTGPVAAAAVEGAEAMAWMAWAGASGGAYSRRRGGPLGRFAAWWAVAEIAALEWPPTPDEVAEAIDRMQWLRREPAGAAHGWSAGLAVHDPGRGISWALHAVDDRREG